MILKGDMKMEKQKPNRFIEELMKLQKCEVRVKDSFGEIHEGICIAVNFTHMNVILMTDHQKICIKNPQVIWRTRRRDGEK